MDKRIPLALAVSGLVVGCASMQEADMTGKSQFMDVAGEAGITTSGARGAGWGDYDNDGCVDLMISEAKGVRLYRNGCDGTFADVSKEAGLSGPAGGFAVAWADYDGDGDLDVYIASADEPNSLYRNNGNGTFANVAVTAGVGDERASTGATWGDYDSDGDLDLFVANRFFSTPESLITDRLYRNDGNGRFTDVGEQLGVAVVNRKTFMGAWLDYDRNGTLDLYQAVDFGDDRLFSNDGKGGFTDVTARVGISGPAHSMGLAVGDINGDGCFDVISTNNTRGEPGDGEHGPTTLYQNDCKGAFVDATAQWGIEDRATVDWGVNLVDWDNDGDEDISIVSGGMLDGGEKENNVLYENRDGRLVDVTRNAGAKVHGAAFGSAWADYDNDGDLDWFVVNSKKNSVLLENRGTNGHFLRVKLKGIGNRDGIGARVEITADGKTQVKTIQAGKSYASSEELIAHFGLGQSKKVETLKVYWPNGARTQLSGLIADRQITVTQN
jgi:hypothetical protein